MGSFDYTCAVSELAISAGTPALVLPLVELKEGLNGGACSRFSPAFPPVEGIYDDYGFLEDLKPKAFHHAMARAMGRVDADDLISALGDRDGEPIVAKTWRGERPLTFALVRKDAWDAMVRMPTPWGHHASGATGWDLSIQACAEGAGILARAPEILNKLSSELVGLDEEIANGSYSRSRMALMLIRTQLLDGVDEHGAFRSLFDHSLMQPLRSSDVFAGASSIEALAFDMPSAGCSAREIEEGLELCAHTMLCGVNMRMVRKIWLDRDSSGPQCGEWAMHWLWARNLSRIASSEMDWDADDSYVAGAETARETRRADQAAMEALSISEAAAPGSSRPKRGL